MFDCYAGYGASVATLCMTHAWWYVDSAFAIAVGSIKECQDQNRLLPLARSTVLGFGKALGYAEALLTMRRYKCKPATVFSPRIDSFMNKFSMVLAALIVCLGPCVGVIAAGMIFGKGFTLG